MGDELEAQMREFKEGISEGAAPESESVQSVEEGYSSVEIAAESELEKEAVEAEPASEPEAAEIDHEANVETTEPETEEAEDPTMAAFKRFQVRKDKKKDE